MDETEPAIVVNNISKSFRLPHEKQNSLKGIFVGVSHGRRTFEQQKVLDDVSFTVNKGEFFGIVGRNGSGKSTLLKLLAGIYEPDKGSIQVNGSLTPFIELGVGFNPELTGRENVFLNGALLGFNRKEIQSMYKDIVEFAEIEKFMDQKLKNYSSGMQVRLAFSIAIRAKSDILLIDEVLAVGDAAFQQKCYEVFLTIKEQGRTVVFVTHDMTAVERFCDKAIVVDAGELKGIFSPRDAGTFYDELNADHEASQKQEGDESDEKKEKKKRWGSGEVRVQDIEFLSDGKTLRSGLAVTGDNLDLKISLTGNEQMKVTVGLLFEDAFGVNVSGPNSKDIELTSSKKVIYSIDKLALNPGRYKITVVVFDPELINEYDHWERAFTLKVRADSRNVFGKVNLFGGWSNEK